MEDRKRFEPERRRFWRAAFRAPVRVVARGMVGDAQLLDISLDGALLEMASHSKWAAEEPCQLRIELGQGDATIVMNTQVSRTGPGRRLGLRRTSIDCDSITLLRRLLDFNAGDTSRSGQELRELAGSAST